MHGIMSIKLVNFFNSVPGEITTSHIITTTVTIQIPLHAGRTDDKRNSEAVCCYSDVSYFRLVFCDEKQDFLIKKGAFNVAEAREIFNMVCRALDSQNWHYRKDEDNLLVRLSVSGENFTVELLIVVREDSKVLSIYSPLTFKAPEEKRTEISTAVCVANYGMIRGSFEFDIRDGEIRYKMAQSYRYDDISEDGFKSMLALVCSVVDDYSGKFFALEKEFLSLEKFIEDEYS